MSPVARVVLIAAALYVFEFVASDFVFPRVTIVQWVLLVVCVAAIALLKNRDEVVNHHLPH